MSLDNESRKAMIAYRLEKADAAMDDAIFLSEAGRYNLSANRLYYALYHAASALLKGLRFCRAPSRHPAEEGMRMSHSRRIF